MQGDNETIEFVFPARAGMSPIDRLTAILTDSVPRASGDEPQAKSAIIAGAKCSPRERG